MHFATVRSGTCLMGRAALRDHRENHKLLYKNHPRPQAKPGLDEGWNLGAPLIWSLLKEWNLGLRHTETTSLWSM